MTINTCNKVYELPLYSCTLFIYENLFVISKKVKHSSLLFKSYNEKFAPFSFLSNREIIICLSFIERTDRFRFKDMLVFEL